MSNINLSFILSSALLGVGLAMDAFCVSMANGLNEPKMKKSKMCLIAGTFGIFQILMPLIGWICVHTIAEKFQAFNKFIPWIALILLGYIGGKMLISGIRGGGEDEDVALNFGELFIQGIATSIDALSVGFTIAHYNWQAAVLASVIIGVVTFFICCAGLIIGKKFGTTLCEKAQILGGSILIFIGLKVFFGF